MAYSNRLHGSFTFFLCKLEGVLVTRLVCLHVSFLTSLTGKGDVISCDYSTVQSLYIPQANASLRVQTHGEIHSVDWSELVAVLKAYPSFREEFISDLELAYNLGTECEVRFLIRHQQSSVRFSQR